MSKKITVEIFEKEKRIELTNPDGKKVELQGVVIFGGDAELGARVGIGFGSSADAAWATGCCYCDPSLTKYFAQTSAHIAKQVDPAAFNRELNEEEIEEMWNDEEGATIH